MNWLTCVNFHPSLKETSLEGTRYGAGTEVPVFGTCPFSLLRSGAGHFQKQDRDPRPPPRLELTTVCPELSLVTRKKCFRILFIFAIHSGRREGRGFEQDKLAKTFKLKSNIAQNTTYVGQTAKRR